MALLVAIALPALRLSADCTLTNFGFTALPELGPGVYKSFTGGLYPIGANSRPASHDAAGINIAVNQVRPLNASGLLDTNNGKIALLSIGMSNTTQEWATGSRDNLDAGGAFKPRADIDPSKNPQLVIVDGAQGGEDATTWTNYFALTWSNALARLNSSGVSSNQVQVLWIKQALAQPQQYGNFPAHAEFLQSCLERILRNARRRFPNLQMAYISSRTRAYTTVNLNPEPYAYESGWSTKWLIEKQLTNGLPFQGSSAIVPWLAWGPYLWEDGLAARSDGFIWECQDVRSDDFTHPSHTGVRKVADQLLAFFKTDPTATPWFLRKRITNQPPSLAPSASPASGAAPLTVNFNANATDADGTIREVTWTFDDGTFATNASPTKTFTAPGIYRAHVTAMDNAGNPATSNVTVVVTSTFELWRRGKFASNELADLVVSGPNGDPDRDQMSNLIEYLMGLEPKTAEARWPMAVIENGYFTLTYPSYIPATDYVLQPEGSDDLVTWSSAQVEFTGSGTNGAISVLVYSSTTPVPATPHRFFRVSPVSAH